MISERLFIESEIAELKQLLALTPGENIIDRLSLEARLEEVKRNWSLPKK